MQSLYNIGIAAYNLSLRLAVPFSHKAKLWREGRKNLLKDIERALAGEENLVWFHCASLGEFEQGRPLIEAHKMQFPEQKIVLTFFSPSGYQVRKKYEQADFVFYLPIDTPSNAERFLDILKPRKIFFIKYEFWFNYLQEIKERKVPCYLVSGIFRKDQLFFKPYGSWAKEKLNAFSCFFVQNEESAKLLEGIGFSNYLIAGDTRFDRVWQIAQNAKDVAMVEKFCSGAFTVIFGSSWPAEDEVAVNLIANEHYTGKVIIAPHELSVDKIEKFQSLFQKEVVLWTELQNNPDLLQGARVLIIDVIGLLSSIYRYADLAVIGGGFGKGVHNVLEAATFGLPVLLGPHYHKFEEVKQLIDVGAAASYEDTKQLTAALLALFKNRAELEIRSKLAKQYVQDRVGATEKIMVELERSL